MTGRKHSPESLAKLSGENHYIFGKTHSQEAKDQISASMKGIRLSEFLRGVAETRRAARAFGT
jgi:hypothetical protein